MLDAMLEQIRSVDDADQALVAMLSESRSLRIEAYARALTHGYDDDPLFAEVLCDELGRLDASEECIQECKEALTKAASLRWAGLCPETTALALASMENSAALIDDFAKCLDDMDPVQAALLICLLGNEMALNLARRAPEAASVLIDASTAAPGHEGQVAYEVDPEMLRGLLDAHQIAYRDESLTRWSITLRYRDAFEQRQTLQAELGLTGRSVLLRAQGMSGDDATLMDYNHTAGLARFGRAFDGSVSLTAEIDRSAFTPDAFARALDDFVGAVEFTAGYQPS